ncbi:KH domain-containing protein [Spiroplasma endosymbiont of Eupeodes luniger]|uniref:KH domain-containing protein n=1 Tax=Spiroplasma endosymbiont of Eupeodes luniger TaxID=3066300 RepID=UPI0030CE00D0
MMNYINTVKILISPIVKDINNIQIRMLNENDNELEILIMTSDSDFARLIGKKGLIIDSIRRLVNVKASREQKRIKVSLEAFNE